MHALYDWSLEHELERGRSRTGRRRCSGDRNGAANASAGGNSFPGESAAEIVRILVQVGLVLGLGVLFGARIETGLPAAVGIALVGIRFST